jgi:hypothetical protein
MRIAECKKEKADGRRQKAVRSRQQQVGSKQYAVGRKKEDGKQKINTRPSLFFGD